MNDRTTTLLPMPRSVVQLEGTHRLGDDTALETPGATSSERSRYQRLLRFLPFNLEGDGTRSRLSIRVDIALPAGEYQLTVDHPGVSIVGSDPDACAAGLHVLRQLLPSESMRLGGSHDVEWQLPACRIDDGAAVSWRGVLLDVARHFVPVREVLRLIDMMALHRLNRLQLHLTDDQGWRLESRLFPALHEIGGSRERTQRSDRREALVFDETPHGGFYTHRDAAEIIRYAADRGIVVIPEIEFPGHAGAMAAAYPEHCVPAGRSHRVMGEWGINDALVSPMPSTREFVADLLGEVCDLFPSPWIHVGADESRLSVWEADPAIAAYARAEFGGSIRRLFADFVEHICSVLRRHDRTTITWDDAFAVTGSAPQGSVIMAWRGLEVARRAAAAGHQVVLAPVMPLYFDYAQSDHDDEPLSNGGPITIDDVRSFEPIPLHWSAAEASRVLGAQVQLWSEWVPDTRSVEYLLFPRTCAFAEVVWSGRSSLGDDTWDQRLDAHLGRLDEACVEYRPLKGPRPWQRGGQGWRRNRTYEPISAKMAELRRAADAGGIAFVDDLIDEPLSRQSDESHTTSEVESTGEGA